MKRLATIALWGTGAWLIGNLLFFWTNAIIDSYFYWAFSEYIRTGIYPFAAPFIYARPTTISPPLYSVLLFLLEIFPKPELVIRIIQTLLLISSGILIYRILKRSVSGAYAAISACLFILIPANTVYVNYLLTEIMAQFFVAVLIYCLVQNHIRAYGAALIWGAWAAVAKYSLVVYMGVAGIWLLLSRPKSFHFFIYPGITILILTSWIYINWRVTGVVGLSDTKGVQLYNQLVWIGQNAPDETSVPMQTLRQFVPVSIDIKKAYWDLQGYILPSVGNSWPAVDRMLGAVAKESLREHPVLYIKNTINIFFTLHGNALPYWYNLSDFGKPQGVHPLTCGMMGSFELCVPPIQVPMRYALWNGFIALSNIFYTKIFPILSYILFFPSLVAGFWAKNIAWRRSSFLYLLGVIPISMYVHPDTRYIMPFYPLYVIIISFGIHDAVFLARKLLKEKNLTIFSR